MEIIELIGILDFEQADRELLAASIARSARFEHVKSRKLYLNRRTSAGWLEYLLMIEFDNGQRLTVGCLQRTHGANVEFHS